MLIDEKFFTGDLHIDGLVHSDGVPSLTNDAILSEFNGLSAKFEREFYFRILGRDNAEGFISFLDAVSNYPDNGYERKWIDLKDILVYDSFGVTESPIAYYIYFFYVRRNQIESTPVGVVKADAGVVKCNRKMIDAWNRMVSMNVPLSIWLFDHRDDYGGYYFDRDLLETINQLGI